MLSQSRKNKRLHSQNQDRKNGKVITTQGDHHVSCYYEQSDTKKALGYHQQPEPQDDNFKSPPDITVFMLKRALSLETHL